MTFWGIKPGFQTKLQTRDMDNDWVGQATEEVLKRTSLELGRYYAPNGGLENYLKTFDLSKISTPIFILRGGNGVGKSAMINCLIDYISMPYSNQYFEGIEYLRNFKRPNRGRVITTPNAARYAYPAERNKWALHGRFTAHKDGASFERRITYENGSEYDIFTHDQDPVQGESITLDWAVIDEPMPYAHWVSLISRLRFGGPIFIIMTPLEGSGWIHDFIETPERVNKDVFLTEVEGEMACVDHGIRGHLPHSYFESLKKECLDENELNARLSGKYYHLHGLVLKNFSLQYHVINELSGYHAECYEKGLFSLYHVLDPHDRKAFAMAWHVVFPNEDKVTIAEYPQFNFYREHSSDVQVPEYVKLIKETEDLIGKKVDVRLIDPNFGNSPKKGGNTVKQDFESLGMYFQDPPDNLEAGHIAIRKELGKPNVIRPKYQVMAHCINTIFALSHYRYEIKKVKTETGSLSDRVTLEYKDHVDLIRYPLLWGMKYLHPSPKELNLSKPMRSVRLKVPKFD